MWYLGSQTRDQTHGSTDFNCWTIREVLVTTLNKANSKFDLIIGWNRKAHMTHMKANNQGGWPRFYWSYSYWNEVKVTQSCPTLCNPMDYTLLGILQARTLEWVAIPFSKGSSQPRSPILQADSLPAETPTRSHLKIVCVWWAYTNALSFQLHVNMFLFLSIYLFILSIFGCSESLFLHTSFL